MFAALLALALAGSAVHALPILSPQSAWVMDASVANYTPVGVDWTNIPPKNPIDMALRDLRRDWYKVLGVPPTVLTALPSGAWDGDCLVLVALATPGSVHEESFTLAASQLPSGACLLTLTGGGVRGLVYGIFHLSADFLGVDPLWWFNDLAPVYEPAGVAVAPSYAYDSGAPAFNSRGAFNNDEDLSGYFFSSPLGDAVYHTDFADRFCEALLRLRCNTFIPSTFAYIDESHYRVAAARGLRLGNHHVMPMGNNVFAWPKGISYAYRLNPEPFQAAWRTLADFSQRQQQRHMVYSLGYRGVNDEPFWNQDTQCTTTECRGATISQAIANQSQIALATPYAPGAQPQFVAYMWMELLALKEAGTLVLPPGVSCVWTDFPGAFLFEGGFDNVTKNDGFYGHISMMNGQAGQLTEFIPLARMFANIWQFFSRQATAYGMINLSDLKFVPLTGEAVYRYLWSPQSFNASAACAAASAAGSVAGGAGRQAGSGRRGHLGAWPLPTPGAHGCKASDFGAVTPTQAQDAFVLEFSQRHYGAAAAPAAAAAYGAYFNISYMADAVPGAATKADHYLGSQLRTLISHFSAGNKDLAGDAKTCGDLAAANLPAVAALYQGAVVPLAGALPPGPPTRFYQTHLAPQAAIHYYHLQAFASGAAGAYALLGGSLPRAIGNVTLALGALDALLGVLRVAEGTGAWHGSYAADGWTWVWGSRQALAALLARLQGKVTAAVPSNPYPDYEIMIYETDVQNPPTATPTFPFFAFNASVAFDRLPRFACAGDIPPSAGGAAAAVAAAAAASCSSTWVGVTISGGAGSVGFFTAPYDGPGARVGTSSVYYTLDGTAPSTTAQRYTAPFSVSQAATVRAQSFDDATGLPVSGVSAGEVVVA